MKADSKKSHRTYESCHRHFSCPDGEECWYHSEDYYWDVGKGAMRLTEEWNNGRKYEREKLLKSLETQKEEISKRYNDACDMEAGKWVGGNLTSEPYGELKAIKQAIESINKDK